MTNRNRTTISKRHRLVKKKKLSTRKAVAFAKRDFLATHPSSSHMPLSRLGESYARRTHEHTFRAGARNHANVRQQYNKSNAVALLRMCVWVKTYERLEYKPAAAAAGLQYKRELRSELNRVSAWAIGARGARWLGGSAQLASAATAAS